MPEPSSFVAREKFEELTYRDLMARAQAKLQARGEFDPAKHGDPDKYPSLALQEHLEVLAVGELLARMYRWAGYIDYALNAGANWAQIAEALGCSEESARQAYGEWATSQHQLFIDYDGKFGMSDSEHAEAIARCSE
jgi:hypothetical protein